MTCTEARALLPLLIYDGLDAEEAAVLRGHLAACPDCRREHDALRGVGRLLDVPAPRVEVDLPRLYRTLAEQEAQRARRWRRVALALGAVAALLLVSFGLRLEVRLEAGQMVVRWGQPPAPVAVAPAPAPPAPQLTQVVLSPETEARLRLLSELIQALDQDAESRDQRYQEQITSLEKQLQALQWQANQRWSLTEKNVAALYFLARKGEEP